jgi:hypothetical protein
MGIYVCKVISMTFLTRNFFKKKIKKGKEEKKKVKKK